MPNFKVGDVVIIPGKPLNCSECPTWNSPEMDVWINKKLTVAEIYSCGGHVEFTAKEAVSNGHFYKFRENWLKSTKLLRRCADCGCIMSMHSEDGCFNVRLDKNFNPIRCVCKTTKLKLEPPYSKGMKIKVVSERPKNPAAWPGWHEWREDPFLGFSGIISYVEGRHGHKETAYGVVNPANPGLTGWFRAEWFESVEE